MVAMGETPSLPGRGGHKARTSLENYPLTLSEALSGHSRRKPEPQNRGDCISIRTHWQNGESSDHSIQASHQTGDRHEIMLCRSRVGVRSKFHHALKYRLSAARKEALKP